jgi:hypothetical protein
MFMKPAPERPELDELLRNAAKRRMTPSEIREQRRSWVRGELMLANPELTREEADRRITEAERLMGYDNT